MTIQVHNQPDVKRLEGSQMAHYPTVCLQRVDHKFCKQAARYIAVCGSHVRWLCEHHVEAFAHPAWKVYELWRPHV